MEFGWINFVNLCIVALMMVPNLIYARRNPGEKNHCPDPRMNLLEKAGRYGCVALMFFPLGIWEFGFSGKIMLIAYLVGNILLLGGYGWFWCLYFQKKTMKRAMALTLIPVGIFLLCGITLNHGLLLWAAAAFGIGHSFVTWINHLEGIEWES